MALKGRTRKLRENLKKRFPNEDVDLLEKILLRGVEKGFVTYGEVVELGGTVDLILSLEEEKVLIPSASSKSLSWEDRCFSFKNNEKFEMPNIIRKIIKVAVEKGIWSPTLAFKEYLQSIGEKEIDRMVELLQKIINKRTLIVSAEEIKEIAAGINMEERINTIISELKGSGVISPCLRGFIREKKVVYELNKFILG